MGEVFEIASVEWQPVRPEIARGVWGRTMLDGQVKGVLTRVVPGGKFPLHHDQYGHLFYFLSGEGVVWLGEKQFTARAGVVVRVVAGEDHAYENAGHADLDLISLNVPVS